MWGWWSWSSGRGSRGGIGWIFPLIFFWFIFGGRSSSFFTIVLTLIVIGLVVSAFSRRAAPPMDMDYEEMEKRKRDSYDEYSFEDETEKPKREPRYGLGDDGELVELPPEEEYDPPRRRNEDDSYYR